MCTSSKIHEPVGCMINVVVVAREMPKNTITYIRYPMYVNRHVNLERCGHMLLGQVKQDTDITADTVAITEADQEALWVLHALYEIEAFEMVAHPETPDHMRFRVFCTHHEFGIKDNEQNIRMPPERGLPEIIIAMRHRDTGKPPVAGEAGTLTVEAQHEAGVDLTALVAVLLAASEGRVWTGTRVTIPSPNADNLTIAEQVESDTEME